MPGIDERRGRLVGRCNESFRIDGRGKEAAEIGVGADHGDCHSIDDRLRNLSAGRIVEEGERRLAMYSRQRGKLRSDRIDIILHPGTPSWKCFGGA